MPINFDKAFGVHDNALLLFERRTQLLTSNIANADTPGYKARDIDFNNVLQNVQSDQLRLQVTSEKHIPVSANELDHSIKFRIPEQSSADGNTVDVQKEKAAFAENTIRYQTTLNVLSRRIDGLRNAFKGE
ncbi:MAG: flagellar basal body rod protein FlgB [Gammaproteobacteria bacterium]|nr:flagellar basal body rod protein FlgB [Gammaproteobacteria bacterium]MDH5736622.1 flagellar basal body rod protein FlgB [Gammaproteobacteria bacterium]